MPTVRISVDSGLLGEVTADTRSTWQSGFSGEDERGFIEEALNEAVATIRRAYNIDTKENS